MNAGRGHSPDNLAAAVADLLRLLSNTRSVPGTTERPWQGQRDAYLGWVEDAERRLRGLTGDDPAPALHTARYWRIRDLTAASYRPAALVDAETDAQHARLTAVAAALPPPATGPGGAVEAGVRALLDTNTHLHFPRFDDHGWAIELGGGPVVVVVPLLVLEELDDKKNQGAPVLGRRAGEVVRRVLRAVEDERGGVDTDTRVELAPPSHHGYLTTTDGIVLTGQAVVEVRAAASTLRAAAQALEDAIKTPDVTFMGLRSRYKTVGAAATTAAAAVEQVLRPART